MVDTVVAKTNVGSLHILIFVGTGMTAWVIDAVGSQL